MCSHWQPLGLALVLMLSAAPLARAHDLGASVKLAGGRVEVKAYFDDGTVARAAKTVVRDQGNDIIFEGATDGKGIWTFPIPKAGKYELEVNAGAGHLARVPFTIPKQSPANVSQQPGQPGGNKDLTKGEKENPSPGGPPVVVSQGPTEEEFTRFPWLKVGVGVGVIGLVCLALLVALRQGRNLPSPGDTRE
jgi:hypothetical protein